jgi:hypothetical protein
MRTHVFADMMGYARLVEDRQGVPGEWTLEAIW